MKLQSTKKLTEMAKKQKYPEEKNPQQSKTQPRASGKKGKMNRGKNLIFLLF